MAFFPFVVGASHFLAGLHSACRPRRRSARMRPAPPRRGRREVHVVTDGSYARDTPFRHESKSLLDRNPLRPIGVVLQPFPEDAAVPVKAIATPHGAERFLEMLAGSLTIALRQSDQADQMVLDAPG